MPPPKSLCVHDADHMRESFRSFFPFAMLASGAFASDFHRIDVENFVGDGDLCRELYLHQSVRAGARDLGCMVCLPLNDDAKCHDAVNLLSPDQIETGKRQFECSGDGESENIRSAKLMEHFFGIVLHHPHDVLMVGAANHRYGLPFGDARYFFGSLVAEHDHSVHTP